ncbi:DUF4232 domain-containing protein [Streptomyces griseoaurantiacus]|uniref:DUF4232 domain-containing protein n=1 Tax=Streptomyces griseoaurantiacus TaxID=68213 RepID=UPI002E2AC7A8|nr:DUF4232 domain-containing protein [Streptomyces jietaisiensis]
MTVHRRLAGAACLLAVSLLTAGCGLSAELDRESDPDRRPDTTPARTPSAPAVDTPAPGPAYGLPGRPTRSPAPDTTACPASGLRLEPGPVEAAMGLRAMTVRLTNCGKESYAFGGYPVLTALDEDRAPLVDVEVRKGPGEITGVPDPGAHPVRLARGESATSSLVWRNTVTDPTTTAVNAPYLRVAPTEGAPAAVLTVDGGLDLGNTGRIGTTAWKKADKAG